MTAGRFFLVLRGAVNGHRWEEGVSDDRVADEWVANVLEKCGGHERLHGYGYGRAMPWPSGQVSDDGVADDWVGNVLGNYQGHGRFHGYGYGRAMAWPWPSMSVVRSMSVAVSLP